jgi:hypothetical protein
MECRSRMEYGHNNFTHFALRRESPIFSPKKRAIE